MTVPQTKNVFIASSQGQGFPANGRWFLAEFYLRGEMKLAID